MKKTYISAQQLLEDSFNLAIKIFESGFRPDYIVGVWRGGAPVGIAVQEVFELLGVKCDHIAIRTSSYVRIGERAKKVNVHGLTYLLNRVESHQNLLIVDDVHDSGLSIQQTILDLSDRAKKNTPHIRVATPYYKPGNNKTDREPDYFLYESDEWLVFPHELEGLTKEELLENRPEFESITHHLDRLGAFDRES
jgi:hypoxanthine phosphoribosyltransferase